MKKLFALFILACLPALQVAGQCRIAEIISKNKAEFSEPYKYDGFSYSKVEFNEQSSAFEKEFIAFKGQKYQLLFCTSGFEETVRITITDTKDNSLVAGTAVGSETTVWSFLCSKTGTYSIRYEIPASETGVTHDGCVAMLIGFSEK